MDEAFWVNGWHDLAGTWANARVATHDANRGRHALQPRVKNSRHRTELHELDVGDGEVLVECIEVLRLSWCALRAFIFEPHHHSWDHDDDDSTANRNVTDGELEGNPDVELVDEVRNHHFVCCCCE